MEFDFCNLRLARFTYTNDDQLSNFKVGAAVLLENNITVKGSNQENAAYPSGLCAERVALFSAGSQYPGIKIKSIAVTAFKNLEPEPCPASPCGACRQVMARLCELIAHGSNAPA